MCQGHQKINKFLKRVPKQKLKYVAQWVKNPTSVPWVAVEVQVRLQAGAVG